MSIRGWTLGVTLAAALFAVACERNFATADAEAVTPSTPEAVRLVVQNNNFADVDVYVVRDGDATTRLGTVTGESNATFVVEPSLFPTGTLALVAQPIGGFGAARSGPVSVSPGQTVTFTIQPDLRTSMATVR